MVCLNTLRSGFEGLENSLTYQFDVHFIHYDGEVTTE